MKTNSFPAIMKTETYENFCRENYIVQEITGKSIAEVLNEYTLPELLRLQAYIVFLDGLPI